MSQFDPLFSYAHIRSHYLNSDLATGSLEINNFLRPEHRAICNSALLADRTIFTTRPNTLQQHLLSPISRQILWELHSGIMIRLLENITNLQNLLPDVHCRNSMLIFPNSDLSALKQHDEQTGLAAALVTIVYLDTGNAVLYTSKTAMNDHMANGSALYMTYLHHACQ